ncbi:MAG TPA: OmpA family protein [Candidatus Eisenbacteria bacterium]|jgi:chemotaxis protein MotB
MKQTLAVALGVLVAAAVLAAVGFGGYVLFTKFQKLEAERDVLRSDKQRLTQDVAKLDGELAELRSEANALATKRDSLSTERNALQQARDAIASERDSLRRAQAEAVSHYDALVNQLSQEVNQGHLQIKQYKNMLTVDVADKIFFDSGSADIKETGMVVLKKVGTALALYPDKIIRVVGHTDNIPLSRAAQENFSTNWELSVARATTVVRFLQDECTIAPERLVAAGRGPYQPVARNDTPAGRQRNRRIEIMLLDKSLADGMVTATAP